MLETMVRVPRRVKAPGQPTPAAELSSAGPPAHAAKFMPANLPTVFENVCTSFGKKSFGSSTVAEYNLVVGRTGVPRRRDRGKSRVSRNRLQLRRAIEEAEGYLELGMRESMRSRRWSTASTLVDANGRASYLMGETLRELARYEEALSPLQRSADLVPDDIHVWLALGWCYKRTGKLAKAIEALEHAVEVDPGEAVHPLQPGLLLEPGAEPSAGTAVSVARAGDGHQLPRHGA